LVRPTVKEARAALFASICMTVVGTCGLGGGLAGLDHTSRPATPAPPPECQKPEPMDFLDAVETDPLREVLWESPHRRPLAATNAVVSSMLLIGSFLLTFRRKTALWWIRNAVAANVLFILGNLAHTVARLVQAGPALYARIEAHSVYYPDLAEPLDGRFMVMQSIAIAAIGAALNVALHLALAWRCHRPDVRGFLESGAEPSE
jgi:hypothetical protein